MYLLVCVLVDISIFFNVLLSKLPKTKGIRAAGKVALPLTMSIGDCLAPPQNPPQAPRSGSIINS